jgi:hypothetical protein
MPFAEHSRAIASRFQHLRNRDFIGIESLRVSGEQDGKV